MSIEIGNFTIRRKLNYKWMLFIIIILYFLYISTLLLNSSPKFISPDETINYYFSTIYSSTGNLYYSDELNKIASGIIHPRGSIYIDNNNNIVPGKFIGFPFIVGNLMVNLPLIWKYITGILSLLGVLLIYIIIKDISSKKNALLSSGILIIMPAYFYWSTMYLYENIMGCFFILLSLKYFNDVVLGEKKTPSEFLAGFFLGMALFVRPDYVIFILPPFLFICILYRRHIRVKGIIIAFIALMLPLIPLFYFNNLLYGNFIKTGFHTTYSLTLLQSTGQLVNISNVGFLMPLFDDFHCIINNFYELLKLNTVFVIFIFFGLLYSIKNFKKENNHFQIFYISSLTLYALFILKRSAISLLLLHNSYVRYALPLYALSVFFISLFIIKYDNRSIKPLIVLILIVTSITTAFPELEQNIKTTNEYFTMSEKIVKITEPNAVIFTHYWDKVFFPERRVGIVKEIPGNKLNRSKDLCEIIIRIHETGTPVYVHNSRQFNQVADYAFLKREFQLNGYILMHKEMDLYKIETNQSIK